MYTELLSSCTLCPRECGVNRLRGETGFCRCGEKVRIARAGLHMWEEPCISGSGGAGTVFFSGCSLRCCYCQNYQVSHEGKGFELTAEELAQVFLSLQCIGAETIELVTGAQYVPMILTSLDICGERLKLPVVYNSGGYESLKTLELLRGRVDVFLPDIKYSSPELAQKYSKAADYPETAFAAVKKMVDIAGKPRLDDKGRLLSGVVVRHLALPGCRHDTEAVLRRLADEIGTENILLSLMSQYIPVGEAMAHKELSRRISTFEYNRAAELAQELGFSGYFQQRSAAKDEYVPEFYDDKNEGLKQLLT